MADLRSVTDLFGVEKLTCLQWDTIQNLMEGKDVFLSIRTGGGKSLCYQAYPVIHGSPCQILIVTPLLSIMKEQMAYLRSLGLKSDYIHKDCEVDSIKDGTTTYVFTSPEAILSDDKWRTLLLDSNTFKLFVVDEAHMIINWGECLGAGEPFREWYGRLGEIRSLITCPALVITATASKATRRTLKKKLALINCYDIVESPDRENIILFVYKFKERQNLQLTFSWLIDMINIDSPLDCPRHILFCPSIKLCADVYSMFRIYVPEKMDHIEMFHSCTTEIVKDEIRQDMDIEKGKIRILIATSAAGMGVNYKGLNNIIHYGPPKDLDAFIQQLGRAGRDGSQSYEILLYSSRHLKKVEIDMVDYIKNNDVCRRKKLLEAYDSLPNESMVKHLCCDICAKSCACEDQNCELFNCKYLDFEESTCESVSDGDSDSERD